MLKNVKYLIPILLFTTFVQIGCVKDDEDVPECIDNLIDQEGKNACADATVDEYTFEGQSVYVLNFQNCFADGGSEVRKANCEIMGLLGGIIGNVNINGKVFDQNAIFVRTVWKK